RKRRISVVLPLPRKPVTTATGSTASRRSARLAGSGRWLRGSPTGIPFSPRPLDGGGSGWGWAASSVLAASSLHPGRIPERGGIAAHGPERPDLRLTKRDTVRAPAQLRLSRLDQPGLLHEADDGDGERLRRHQRP